MPRGNTTQMHGCRPSSVSPPTEYENNLSYYYERREHRRRALHDVYVPKHKKVMCRVCKKELWAKHSIAVEVCGRCQFILRSKSHDRALCA